MTDFRKRKLRTHFRTFDLSGDRKLGKDDFRLVADNFIKAIGAESKSDDIHKKWDAIWEFLSAGKDDAIITEESFVQRGLEIQNSPEGREMMTNLYGSMFDAIDVDGDNLVDLGEFKAFLSALRISTEHAQAMFSAIDVDGDGSLQKNEVTEAFVRYSTSDDPNDPTALLYGPLAD